MLTLLLIAAAFAALGLAAGLLVRPWVAVLALVLIGVGLAGVAWLGHDPNAADVGHDDMSDEAGMVLGVLFFTVPAGLGCAMGVAAKYGRQVVRRSDWLT
ncbi:MAG: hypothetical protein ACEQSX_04880 [Baekduiaceae bacterium]